MVTRPIDPRGAREGVSYPCLRYWGDDGKDAGRRLIKGGELGKEGGSPKAGMPFWETVI